MAQRVEVLIQGLHTVYHERFYQRPTIVFLHDSLGCTELWRGFPELLSETSRCNTFIYDRKGYGKSAPNAGERPNDYLAVEARVLVSLIDSRELTDVILFGHSDGGSIALIAAAKFPNRIKAVITEGAHVFVEEETLAGIRTVKKEYLSTNLKHKLEKYHGSNTDWLFYAWTNTWLSDRFRSWNIEHFLPQVACPVLVIQGENDEFGTMAQVDAIASQIAGPAETLIVPEAKHTPHKENPEVVVARATRWIQGLL